MKKNLKFYNEHGQVKDWRIAYEMAHIEDLHREPFLRIFPASKNQIAEGEKKSECYGENMFENKIREKRISDIQSKIKNFCVNKKGIKRSSVNRGFLECKEVSFELDHEKYDMTFQRGGDNDSYNLSYVAIDGNDRTRGFYSIKDNYDKICAIKRAFFKGW
ncbi:MAG TPA: hypothetical protein ENG87_00480 [Candidatus Pacearchaeota archaeon]|nr:hypothetical protein BMS3Abin17_00357 [archaeon BMS3Abin17]HDK41824.1 hypothetical protein [Candidatus Pacearchaeota archaeon]HDZ60223.1 hypothetical protein [Candidatus Pacearchaeota archaeon]